MKKNPSWWWGVGALALVITIPLFSTGYVVYIVNLLLVYIVLALGMHLVLGETGQFSLAHAAFYGVGIYTAGLLNNAWHPPVVVSIVVGGAIAALIGAVIGWLSLRVRDIYLALATFAFGEAMQWVFLNWNSVTNGPNGLSFSPAQVFGIQIMSDKHAFPFVLVLGIFFIWLTVIISNSQLGSAFRATKDSEIAALAVGINVRRMKVLSFALSAFYAGAAGGMYTIFASFIHPDNLGFQTTILVLTMVVVGGIGSVLGAVCGAIIFGVLSELLRQALSFQEIILGAILIIIMMYMPEGILVTIFNRLGFKERGNG